MPPEPSAESASGQEGPPAQAEPSASEVEQAESQDAQELERIDFLQAGFEDATGGAKAWAVSWISVYSLLTIYGVYGMLSGSREWKVDLTDSLVTTVKSGLSVITLLAKPFTPSNAAVELSEMPEGTPEERQAKLDRAEALMSKGRKDILDQRTFLNHAVKIGVNLIGGAIIWGVEGKDGWKHASLSTGVGIALSLGTIWTAPTKTLKLHDAYNAQYGSTGEQTRLRPDLRPRIYMAPSFNGASAGIIF